MDAIDRAVNLEDLKRLAKRRMPRAVFDFVEGGADDEVGLRTNEDAFRRCRLVPRYLVDTSRRSLSTMLFGQEHAAPFGIAPTGLNGLFRPDADLHLAAAAAAAGIPFAMSNASVASIEEAVALNPDRTFFQLYGTRDRTVMMDTVSRVADLGVKVLFVTVDVPVGSKRERNFRSGFGIPPRLRPAYLLEALLHPAWLLEYLSTGGIPRLKNLLRPDVTMRTPPLDLAHRFAAETADSSQTWRDLEAVRRAWPGTLVVKGLMHPTDAQQSVALGADAVVVSNHGGRQLDLAPSPLEMLPAVRAVLDPRIPVLLDSGVRRGADVVTAMCLGASFVFVGRATLYGAIAGRQRGAMRAIAILKDEIDRTMAQIGCATTDDFGPQLLMENVLASARGERPASMRAVG